MSPKELFNLSKETATEFGEDKASRLGAAIAYYAVFAMAPLLVLAVSISGLVFGEEAAQGRVVGQISGAVGQEAAEMIQGMLSRTTDRDTGIITTIIGTLTLLLGASGMFLELKGALNTIWEVEPRPGQGFLFMARERLLAIVMALGMGFLLMLSMVMSTLVSAMTGFFEHLLPLPAFALHGIDLLVSLSLLTLVFALIYKGLPDTEISWRDVWLGAIVTAVLFTIGKFAIGFYLGQAAPASSYGAAGALVLVLLWVYYSSQILFLGAEFTQVYANRHGSRMHAASDAVPAVEHFPAAHSMPEEEGRPGERQKHEAEVKGRFSADSGERREASSRGAGAPGGGAPRPKTRRRQRAA